MPTNITTFPSGLKRIDRGGLAGARLQPSFAPTPTGPSPGLHQQASAVLASPHQPLPELPTWTNPAPRTQSPYLPAAPQSPATSLMAQYGRYAGTPQETQAGIQAVRDHEMGLLNQQVMMQQHLNMRRALAGKYRPSLLDETLAIKEAAGGAP